MNQFLIFEMPQKFEWLVFIFAILAALAVVGVGGALIYFIVKKAIKSAHQDLRESPSNAKMP